MPETMSDDVERRAQSLSFRRSSAVRSAAVIVMRFGEEKSIREIAQEIGRSEGRSNNFNGGACSRCGLK